MRLIKSIFCQLFYLFFTQTKTTLQQTKNSSLFCQSSFRTKMIREEFMPEYYFPF